MSLVVDCSVAMAWVLQDETSSYAEAVLDQVVEVGGIVPELWWIETRNVLLMAERRGRITMESANIADAALRDLGLNQDGQGDRVRILQLARKHNLTSYDAIYLELALREGAPLATLDKGLAKAADDEKALWQM